MISLHIKIIEKLVEMSKILPNAGGMFRWVDKY
jgi:hypothetical protein